MTTPTKPGARPAATNLAFVVFALLGFFTFGATVLDLGEFGLPALALVAALGVVAFWPARQRSSAAVLAAAAAALVAVPAALIGSTALGEHLACGDAEQRALEEVPHPDGVHPSVSGDLQTGGCIVRAWITPPPQVAFQHYAAELQAHGWMIVDESPTSDGGRMAGRSDSLVYLLDVFTRGQRTRVVASVND